jgi:hypothetical protein
VQPGSDDSFPSQQQSVFINNACSVASANDKNIPSVLPNLHVEGPKSVNAGNAPPLVLKTALVQISEVNSKNPIDFDRNLPDPSAELGENSKETVNKNACKRHIKSVVSKSRIPKSRVPRGPNTLNLIEIELSNNLSWGNCTYLSQPPSYCVPLIRRSSGDQSMVYLYSPQTRRSHSMHEQGTVVPTLLFQTQNKSKKHVRFVD